LSRRRFAALLGGAALAPALGPLPALAQKNKLPTIGFLGATTPTVWSPFVAAFLGRLRELGWIDGRTSPSNTVGPKAAASVMPRSRLNSPKARLPSSSRRAPDRSSPS